LCGGASELVRAGFGKRWSKRDMPRKSQYFSAYTNEADWSILFMRAVSAHAFLGIGYGGVWRLYARSRIVNEQTRAELKKILAEIQSGEFARAWIAENKSAQGFPRHGAKRRRTRRSSRWARELRKMMPFLKKKRSKETGGLGTSRPAR